MLLTRLLLSLLPQAHEHLGRPSLSPVVLCLLVSPLLLLPAGISASRAGSVIAGLLLSQSSYSSPAATIIIILSHSFSSPPPPPLLFPISTQPVEADGHPPRASFCSRSLLSLTLSVSLTLSPRTGSWGNVTQSRTRLKVLRDDFCCFAGR